MRSYLTRRFGLCALQIVGISIVIFALVRLIPGDVVDVMLGTTSLATEEQRAEMRALFGLDQPLPVQYANWVSSLFRGEMGYSLRTGRSVSNEIGLALPVTLELTLLAMIVCLLVSLPLGILCALHPNTPTDLVGRTLALIGYAVPAFWSGTLLILVLSVCFHWLPPIGFVGLSQPGKNLAIMVLPATVLGLSLAPVILRLTRSSLLDALHMDYVRVARGKGLREREVVTRHALKNAFLPVLTAIGLQIGYLVGGNIVVEEVFSLPGIGRLVLDSVLKRDYPLVQGAVLVIALFVVFINLAVDLSYALLDPRIRYE